MKRFPTPTHLFGGSWCGSWASWLPPGRGANPDFMEVESSHGDLQVPADAKCVRISDALLLLMGLLEI